MIKTFKPTVALDIDGVLADFCSSFSRLAVTMGLTDTIVTNADQTTWNFNFHVDPVWARVDEMYSFWEGLEPLVDEDDMEALAALAQEAHIMYVTGRRGKESTARQTHRWLQDWDFPEGPVFFVPPKSDKEGVILPNKHQIIGVIDDKPSILTSLAAEGIPVVARDWPYNREVHVPRVGSVKEFVERLGVKTEAVAYLMQPWSPEVVSEWAKEWDDAVAQELRDYPEENEVMSA